MLEWLLALAQEDYIWVDAWAVRKAKTIGWCPMRTLMLANDNTKILIAAMTFFALLVVLLTPDGCLCSGLLDSGLFPVPVPE
jgi:hypothetical protein